MRKTLLTVAMAALLCLPALAQRPGAGRGFDISSMVFSNEGVQKELKLTDDQKKELAKAAKDRQEAFAKAREDMDMEGFQKAQEAYSKAVAKVKEGLKPEQKKRLLGIEVQTAERFGSVAIYKNKDLLEALDLTAEQKKALAATLEEYEKDVKEIRDEAGQDFAAAFRKMQALGKETFGKINKSLTEKQAAALKEIKGEKFEVAFPKGGFNPKGKGKDKPKAKTDDL